MDCQLPIANCRSPDPTPLPPTLARGDRGGCVQSPGAASHSAFRIPHSRSAFTLVEILVVIAIIGLLVAALLPAFGHARTTARKAQTSAQFQALATGLEMFKGESALGGVYPPSAGDKREDFQLIANPKKNRPTPPNNEGSQEIKIAGAHLLVHAMIGADQLGTAGFRDLPSGPERGKWWDDTHDEEGGLYHILETPPERAGQTAVTRYPPGGGGYVDDKMKTQAVSLATLESKGLVMSATLSEVQNLGKDELLFMDPWDHPILYYRANSHNIRMTTAPGTGQSAASGIYRQEDNGIITGTNNDGSPQSEGLDFGSGKVNGHYHAIFGAKSPDPNPTTSPVDAVANTDPQYVDTFARFIIDPATRARPTPVRKDSYLLVSAGPDGRYGTEDDVLNWTKEQK